MLSQTPGRVLDTASVGKIFLLHKLLTEVDAGTRSLEEMVTRRPVEHMDESGIWHLLQTNTLPLYDIAAFIGAFSDNAATNTLCCVLGLPAVQQHTLDPGYSSSALEDVVRGPIPPGKSATQSHTNANANATELVWLRLASASRAGSLSRVVRLVPALAGCRHGHVDGRLGIQPRLARPLSL
nr:MULTISPECIES: serine hydrolase [unclassified Leucobacter]